MQCPTCQVTLQIADRQGIEIDYCPKCRGIWLDRGELEKLIERSVEYTRASSVNHAASSNSIENHYRDRAERDQHHDSFKKRESWLSRLLDFD